MRRTIVLLTVAALLVVTTMFTAAAALAAPGGGTCIYFYNPASGNFAVQKTLGNGKLKLYSTDRPPPSCEYGGILML